ncbi:dynein light intermediate chain-domain-containing protein [Gamsiella multidivaricata]|uniref:dynein light intermediate chain-domain-containing protein n=1 Tax=Gamsiella multidivaricata TaxID=101098 RepID=UPI00221EBB21|nr:dynein light intermediate chain-domain-containing protein [Gamsiella multidivaricata]KAI7829471.1 dynein light intermediate chain-domain-containing protein [Gamsiella multidivaricata]
MAASTIATNTASPAGTADAKGVVTNGALASAGANGVSTAGATPAGAAASNSNNSGTEVWSSLLKSVASSRLVPTKDVIILGDPHSGKSTLIELLKTALPTPSSNGLANGVDGSKTINGVAAGPNGVSNTGNGPAPVMVEMGTGTSEDNMFADGQKKNDLALSYSYWDVDDDEHEDTVARLGLYQIAGSHKSYHALLKYCLNTKTIADSVVVIVLDWSKPWTFMETLHRWVKVLESAIQQICQEGAVATATWTKGKAMMDELQEKLSRFLQDYNEPQSNQSAGTFNESQTFGIGSTDAQSVLLPLTEGCLTNNTGVPIIIVCTKSDHINNLERELDYKEETFDYIQQSLRTICLKYGASLFYTSIHHPHTYADLRQYILHRLLTPSTLNNPQQQQQQQHQQPQHQQPSSFPFRLRAQVVERDQVMVPSGWDSIGKIKVLRNGFDCEGVADGWDMDMKQEGAQADGAVVSAGSLAGARQVYEEVITNPKHNHAPAAIQPLITAEDDQVFLDRFFETLQRANDRTSSSAMGGGVGLGSHGAQGPPVVGPLSSGYTSMLNSHHASPPPSMSTAQSIGSGGRSGANGLDVDDVEGRLKRLTSKSKANGGASSSNLIGPALTEAGLHEKKMKMMMDQARSPPGSGVYGSAVSSSMGGMGSTGAGLARPGGVGSTAAGTIGGAGAATGQAESAAISHFFQSLMTRKGTGTLTGGLGGAGGAGGSAAASLAASPSASANAGSAGAPGSNDA